MNLNIQDVFFKGIEKIRHRNPKTHWTSKNRIPKVKKVRRNEKKKSHISKGENYWIATFPILLNDKEYWTISTRMRRKLEAAEFVDNHDHLCRELTRHIK